MKSGYENSAIPSFRRRTSVQLLALILIALTQAILPAWSQGAPNFGPNVFIINPSMSSATIQTTLTNLSNEAQFSSNRYAVLFQPGTYTVQAPIGYYESIAGLGATPGAVTINGFITPDFGSTPENANVTDNFWRSMENLSFNVTPDTTQGVSTNTLQWGVSQGASLRRMQINGSLELTDTSCGEASGGFISDTVVTGNVGSCSQQQWYTRNSTLGSWSGGVWNMVFSGVQGAPTPNYPTNSYTVLPTTPVSREKPFLSVDGSGNYNVFVPSAQTNSVGTTWSNNTGPGYSIPISQFLIVQPTTTLAAINSALAYGQNLIFTPGIYQYSGSINITNPNTIVLGLGYATLIPQTGTAAISVADVDGVQIAGLIIDAGPISSPVLLQIGVPGGARVSHQSNPTSINDVYFRVGGAEVGTAAISMEIDSNDVILDNIWAWRADHGAGSTPIWTGNAAANGVVVNGDNVTALGLAVEHYEQNQVLWNGNGGETIFYQSELPYDVPSQSAWMNNGVNGYSSYAVSNQVTTHAAYGLGVYSYFDQGVPIAEQSAITVPNVPGVTITDAVSVFLSGSGQINYTVNNVGTTAQSGAITSYVPFYQGMPCSATCPAAPSNLNTFVVAPTQVNLTWTASTTPGAYYSVFRSTTGGFTPSSANRIASNVAGTSYSDTKTSAATTYYYVVEASDAVGLSPASNQASAKTTVNSGGPITTDVLRIDSAYSGTAPPTGWVADEYYSGSGTTSSITHAIVIPSGTVNPAPAAVYQTYRHGASFAYAIPGLTAGNSYIVDLHFVEDFSGASVGYRKFNVSINGTQVLTNFDIDATAGGLYTVTVQSFYAVADATGTINLNFTTGSANSPTVNGIEIGQSNLPVPVAPTGPVATAISENQINLSWNASSTSGVQYEVFRSKASGFTPSPATLLTTTGSTNYSDTSAAPSTTYYYLVEANDGIFTSLPSTQANATSEGAPPANPSPATGLTAAMLSSSQISLFWTGSATPGVQYEIFRSTSSGFTPSAGNLVFTTTATGYVDTGLTGSTTYYYVVEAQNTVGNSAPSNQSSAMTAVDLPASVTVVSGSGQSATVGVNFASPLVVLVEDAVGNPLSNIQVSFAGTGVSFPSGFTVLTNSSGEAQVTAQPSVSGPLTPSASVTGVATPAGFSETGIGIAQTITFAAPPSPVVYGVSPIALNATGGASGNAITYSVVSGPGSVSGNLLTISGAGTVVIAANQAGNASYGAAPQAIQSVVVTQAAQSIAFPALASSVSYGVGSIALGATSNSGLAITYMVTGPATLNVNSLLITGVGTVKVTAAQAGSVNYMAATSVSQSFMVNPAVLTVTASNLSMTVGAAVPTLTASYNGFVNGDTTSVLSGAPSLSTTATTSSAAGIYPIVITRGSLAATNYTFSFVNGSIAVSVTATPTLTTSAALSLVSGGFTATVTISNSGKGAASNVQLTTATLGSTAATTALPLNLGTIAAGSSTTISINFPPSAGSPGAASADKFAGSYSGGSFSSSSRLTLP